MTALAIDRAHAARDLAQLLEDREAVRTGSRSLARKRLERRYRIPDNIFWMARYRVRRSLAEWLDPLIEATLDDFKRELHDMETAIEVARRAAGPDLAQASTAIREAETALTHARAAMAGLFPAVARERVAAEKSGERG